MPSVRLVALYQANARQLITDYVLNHWGIDKPKSPDIIAVERCDTTLDMFPADDQPPAETRPPVRPPVRPNRPKKKKGVKDIR